MDAVARYVQQVDRVLAAACALLPPPEATLPAGEPVSKPAEVPGGLSSLGAGVGSAAEQYRLAGAGVEQGGDAALAAARQALEVAREAARTAEGLRRSTQTQAAALLPAANTPAGLRSLVAAMGSAVTAMNDLLSRTLGQMSGSAEELRRQRAQWQAVLED
jgi:hypothetical protein